MRKSRVSRLEANFYVHRVLTKEEYKAKHEAFNKAKREILGHTDNSITHFTDAMYQEYLEKAKTDKKMTSKEKRKEFNKPKSEILAN